MQLKRFQLPSCMPWMKLLVENSSDGVVYYPGDQIGVDSRSLLIKVMSPKDYYNQQLWGALIIQLQRVPLFKNFLCFTPPSPIFPVQ